MDWIEGAKLYEKVTVDGLFEITRVKSRRPATATNRLILVCRAGRLFGADPEGRVYTGRLWTQRKRTVLMSVLKGTYEIPLKHLSWRCATIRDPSIRVPITGEVDPLARSQNVTVCVGGRPIDIAITYLGPLPP